MLPEEKTATSLLSYYISPNKHLTLYRPSAFLFLEQEWVLREFQTEVHDPYPNITTYSTHPYQTYSGRRMDTG